jgi:hypothetical protein
MRGRFIVCRLDAQVFADPLAAGQGGDVFRQKLNGSGTAGVEGATGA